MFDARFRRGIGPLLEAPARTIRRWGVTANQVTVVGFIVSGAGAFAVAIDRPFLGLSLWLLSRLLDAIDGVMARQAGIEDGFGGFLDITLDMLAYSLMATAFALRHPEHQLVWLLILVGYVGCITTTASLSSVLEHQRITFSDNDRSLQFTPGFAEAGETTIVYILLTVAPAWSLWIAGAWAVVLFATTIQRIVIARRLLRA